MSQKEYKEPTNTKNIFYNRRNDTYFIILDHGTVEELDPETGQIKKRRKRTRETTKTYKEAKAVLRAFQAKKERGDSPAPLVSSVPLLTACEAYIEHSAPRWSDSYLIRQEVHRNRLRAFVWDTEGTKQKPARLWSALDIERLYQWSMESHTVTIPNPDGSGVIEYETEVIGYNSMTKLQSFLRGLWSFMRKDIARYGVDSDIVCLAVLPCRKTKYEAETLTAEQVNNILRYGLDFEIAATAGGAFVLFVLCALMGLRRGEACGIRWSDIEEQDGYYIARITRQRQRVRDRITGEWVERLSVPKCGDERGTNSRERKERSVGVSVKVYDLLQIIKQEQKRYKDITDNDFIYQSCDSLLTGIDPNSKTATKRFQQFLQRYRRKTGDELPPVRLHDMRHTASSLLMGAGVPFEQRCFHLGHAMVGTAAAKYIHDDEDRAAICAAIDDLITVEIARHDFQNLTNNVKFH